MKTPLDPFYKDLAAAGGTDPRHERDDPLQPARPNPHDLEHSLNECNGTETLALIERALMRLASGTYGTCVSCGADISLARLEQNPAVETCDACAPLSPFKSH